VKVGSKVALVVSLSLLLITLGLVGYWGRIDLVISGVVGIALVSGLLIFVKAPEVFAKVLKIAGIVFSAILIVAGLFFAIALGDAFLGGILIVAGVVMLFIFSLLTRGIEKVAKKGKVEFTRQVFMEEALKTIGLATILLLLPYTAFAYMQVIRCPPYNQALTFIQTAQWIGFAAMVIIIFIIALANVLGLAGTSFAPFAHFFNERIQLILWFVLFFFLFFWNLEQGIAPPTQGSTNQCPVIQFNRLLNSGPFAFRLIGYILSFLGITV